MLYKLLRLIFQAPYNVVEEVEPEDDIKIDIGWTPQENEPLYQEKNEEMEIPPLQRGKERRVFWRWVLLTNHRGAAILLSLLCRTCIERNLFLRVS